MPNPSRSSYNPGIQVLESAEIKTAESVRATAGDELKRSISENSKAPAAEVFPWTGGVYVRLSWHDRSVTYLKVALPFSSTQSFPIFGEFSSPDTQNTDLVVKFKALNAEEYAAEAKRRPAAAMFKVLLSLAGASDTPIEYFRVMRIRGAYVVDHRNVSAAPPKDKPAVIPVVSDQDDNIEGIVLPALPPLPEGEEEIDFTDE